MRILTSLMAASVAAAAMTVAAGAAAASPVTPAACTGTVQITSLTFAPPSVSPGQGATATAVVQNCTGQAVPASALWIARYTGAGTGIPAGCPAIDPLPPTSVSVPADGHVATSTRFLVLAGCQATGLHVTVRISSAGVTLAEQSADLPIGAGTPTCRVSYTRQSEWSNGFVASISVTNTSAAPVSGWSVGFAFAGDQQVGTAWNAQVSQAGAQVTATDAGYNRAIPAGGSVSFGFLGSWLHSDAAPTAFTLNGAPCATG